MDIELVLELAGYDEIIVVTLQGFDIGKLDLLTVYLGKLKFASVTDFSLSKILWNKLALPWKGFRSKPMWQCFYQTVKRSQQLEL